MLNFKLGSKMFTPHATKLYEKTNVINVSEHGRIISAATGTLLYVASLTFKKNKAGNLMRYGALYLIYRGLSGNCPISVAIKKNDVQKHLPAVNIRTAFNVNAPRKMVYDTWRDLEKLPHFLKHIKKIKVMDDKHSHWVMKTPGKIPVVEWNAEIIEQEGERELSWRSLPGSMIETAGKLNFSDIGNSTQVNVLITYRPPAGYIGSIIAKYLNPTFKKYVEEDVFKFKNYIEKKAAKA